MPDLDLAAIRARNEVRRTFSTLTPSRHFAAIDDIDALLAEVDRLTAERDAFASFARNFVAWYEAAGHIRDQTYGLSMFAERAKRVLKGEVMS